MDSLSKLGWRLSEDNVLNYFGDELPTDANSVHTLLLDADIRQIVDEATKNQPTNESGEISSIPCILQIQKLRNVAVPKAKENESSTASRLLRLHLTDGKTTFNALEMGGTIKGLDPNTPPGTKICLTNAVHSERGFLLLTPSNCRILGGNVEKLLEKWRLKDHSLTRPRQGESGPPPWVPFGQKPKFADGVSSSQTKNLRVMELAASGQQEAPPVSEEFSQARQEVIAQAMKREKVKQKP